MRRIKYRAPADTVQSVLAAFVRVVGS